jgi:hypothetical protein
MRLCRRSRQAAARASHTFRKAKAIRSRFRPDPLRARLSHIAEGEPQNTPSRSRQLCSQPWRSGRRQGADALPAPPIRGARTGSHRHAAQSRAAPTTCAPRREHSQIVANDLTFTNCCQRPDLWGASEVAAASATWFVVTAAAETDSTAFSSSPAISFRTGMCMLIGQSLSDRLNTECELHHIAMTDCAQCEDKTRSDRGGVGGGVQTRPRYG